MATRFQSNCIGDFVVDSACGDVPQFVDCNDQLLSVTVDDLGNPVIRLCGLIPTLTDQGDGTFLFDNGLGGTTIIDVCGDLVVHVGTP